MLGTVDSGKMWTVDFVEPNLPFVTFFVMVQILEVDRILMVYY